jgi:biotin operon repressor
MADDDTRSARDNTGGTPTEAALIEHLQDVDRPVSLDQLSKATGATREALKTRLEQLEARGQIIVSMGLYHVTVSLVDGAQPIADGGRKLDVDDVDLAPEQIYTLLSNERRRETLRVLAKETARQEETPFYAPVSPLAAVVCTADEEFTPASVPDSGGQHSTYVALTQTHLPLLQDFGAVEYFSRVQKVRLTQDGRALAQLMDVVDDVATEAGD